MGLLVRRKRGPAGSSVRRGAPAARPAGEVGQECVVATCPECGLRLTTVALLCPRCRSPLPLGCSGDCSSCGH